MFWGKRFNQRKNDDSDDDDEDDGAVTIQGSHIYFHGEVNEKNMMDISIAIDQFNDDRKAYREIYLHIQSWGGYVHTALGTASAIVDSESPVTTIIEGVAASAATIIAIAGNDRRIRKNGCMMIHEIYGTLTGKKSVIDDDYINLQNLEKRVLDFFKERTNLSVKKLEKMFKRELEYSAEECVKLNLVDEIINRKRRRV